ncbi:MAG: GNAT family N-acetyltransferase [Geminicoccaceae bacterium]
MIVIAVEDPAAPDIRALLAAGDAWYAALYPAESNHLLDVETLRGPEVTFLAAREDGMLLGIGAVVAFEGYAELKRMWVVPEARGRALGRRILQELEKAAAARGITCLRLETGVDQTEARSLYGSIGFREIEPFGDYRPDPLSVFMEKCLP